MREKHESAGAGSADTPHTLAALDLIPYSACKCSLKIQRQMTFTLCQPQRASVSSRASLFLKPRKLSTVVTHPRQWECLVKQLALVQCDTLGPLDSSSSMTSYPFELVAYKGDLPSHLYKELQEPKQEYLRLHIHQQLCMGNVVFYKWWLIIYVIISVFTVILVQVDDKSFGLTFLCVSSHVTHRLVTEPTVHLSSHSIFPA